MWPSDILLIKNDFFAAIIREYRFRKYSVYTFYKNHTPKSPKSVGFLEILEPVKCNAAKI